MISAFGVEHGEVSKGLSGKNLAALQRVADKAERAGGGGVAADQMIYARGRTYRAKYGKDVARHGGKRNPVSASDRYAHGLNNRNLLP